MANVVGAEERAQVVQWIEEGRTVLEMILRILTDLDQRAKDLEAAHKECARLQKEGEQLRSDLSRLQADYGRSQREREELAHWFTTVMSEAASRLRAPQPTA